jgi:Putative rRNA methylase
MRPEFRLFQNHKDYAHDLWSAIITKGAVVIDATCGNGHDSLALANLALTEDQGLLICIDIQSEAIENTNNLLKAHLDPGVLRNIRFYETSHATFPEQIPQSDLIVYNLGYLPGASKDLTTKVETTLESLKNALLLLKNGGLISIMCYPGHDEGKKEETEILDFISSLDPRVYLCCYHKIINRAAAPSLVLINKKL